MRLPPGIPWVVGALALALGCATPPKPPELDAFERLRQDPATNAAAKRSPELVQSADRYLKRAREEWEDGDLEEAAHSALMGQIKLKHAIALHEQDRAKARIAAAEQETKEATDEQQRVKRDLEAVSEQVGLLKRLQTEAAEKQKLAQQLSAEKQTLETERQRTAATEKLADAELALKTADTVNAQAHAKATYEAARELIARAQQELQQGQFQAAQVTAEQAHKKAAEAAVAARPLYEKDAQSAESRARSEALARDAAALPGIVVKRDVRGSLQRMVLPLPAEAMFNRRETTLAPGRGDTLLDAVAQLMKKYPTYPVQVIGYTDNRGKTGELLALSLARAQSVYNGLVSRGVDARRMVVSGQGGAEPPSDNRTAAGRAQNNRIEIVFLYQ